MPEELDFQSLEALNEKLNDGALLEEYRKPYDHYRPHILARILGSFFVGAGDLIYGKEPSYQKFKAIEIVARIPYQSWEVAAYTLLTALHGNEKTAIALSRSSRFSRLAQDNETMHVVVISQIVRRQCRSSIILHTLIPMLFSFFYFWALYLVYLFFPRVVLETNYLFEFHAFEQYQRFLDVRGEALKREPITSEFLTLYGRNPKSQYEFFRSIRNDELIHRNRSIREIEMRAEQ